MITVFGYPKTRATRITWLLEELGESYQYSLIDFAKGDSQSEAFLAINPAGKVPAIQEDDLVITESGAIVTYLADKFGSGTLIPAAGTQQRARYEQWCYFALTELEQPLWSMGKHKFALPKAQRVEAMLPTAAWEFQKALTLLSAGLGDNDYILGDVFSAADILLAHTLRWGMSFKQPIEQDNLLAYVKRMEAREACQKAWAREKSELA